jgi:hypothetical protein
MKTAARTTAAPAGEALRTPRRVRLPGFVLEEEIGVGDVVKRAAYALGIKPCGGCDRRAAALNRWMVFSRQGFENRIRQR